MMDAKPSPLKLDNFLIIRSVLEAIPPKDLTKVQTVKSEKLPVEMDFKVIVPDKEKLDKFIVEMKMESNRIPEPKAGYSYLMNAQGVFSLSASVKKDRKKVFDSLILYSGLPMMINHLRMYLMTLTGFGPYGQYILPLVDLKALIEKKTPKGEDAK